jgi:hypothetical protein
MPRKYMPEIRPNEKTIMVVGLPATGKSFLTDVIESRFKGSKRPAKIYHTDDYIKHGFEESLYVMMGDLKKDISPIKLIEGIQGYRLLRKGLELESFYPDLVIVTVADRATRQKRYLERKKTLNRGFDASLEKIWGDYIANLGHPNHAGRQPRFVIYNTLNGKSEQA